MAFGLEQGSNCGILLYFDHISLVPLLRGYRYAVLVHARIFDFVLLRFPVSCAWLFTICIYFANDLRTSNAIMQRTCAGNYLFMALFIFWNETQTKTDNSAQPCLWWEGNVCHWQGKYMLTHSNSRHTCTVSTTSESCSIAILHENPLNIVSIPLWHFFCSYHRHMMPWCLSVALAVFRCGYCHICLKQTKNAWQ